VTTRIPSVVVRVKFASRRQLRQAFLRDLSRNTLFVRTETPLPIGEGVLLVLELPGGDQLEVTGEVGPAGSASTTAPPSPAGMNVRLHDFTADKHARIEELLARSRTLVPIGAQGGPSSAPPGTPPLLVPPIEVLVRALRRLLWLCGDATSLGEVDHYQILGLPATAAADEIREACTILRVLLDPGSPPDGLADRLTAAQRTRVTALHAAVIEIERTLTDETLRAEYDAAVFSIVR
jgi:Tfp pilus assembly protein PilZ